MLVIVNCCLGASSTDHGLTGNQKEIQEIKKHMTFRQEECGKSFLKVSLSLNTAARLGIIFLIGMLYADIVYLLQTPPKPQDSFFMEASIRYRKGSRRISHFWNTPFYPRRPQNSFTILNKDLFQKRSFWEMTSRPLLN